MTEFIVACVAGYYFSPIHIPFLLPPYPLSLSPIPYLSEIMARDQTLLKPYEKARPKQKESWREEIIWLRSPFVTCQYLEGFRWLTSHPEPRVGKLKGDKFGKAERSDFDFLQSKQID